MRSHHYYTKIIAICNCKNCPVHCKSYPPVLNLRVSLEIVRDDDPGVPCHPEPHAPPLGELASEARLRGSPSGGAGERSETERVPLSAAEGGTSPIGRGCCVSAQVTKSPLHFDPSAKQLPKFCILHFAFYIQKGAAGGCSFLGLILRFSFSSCSGSGRLRQHRLLQLPPPR